MAKYVFLNMPAYGHVNPTLAVVQELVGRGHAVSYYLTEEFRDSVEATGAVFQPYESKIKGQPPAGAFSAAGVPPMNRIAPMLLEEATYVPSQVMERIRADRPDVIVYDTMCVWAKTVIDELHVPAIVVRATFASNEHFNLFEYMRQRAQSTPGGREAVERLRASMEGGGLPPQAVRNFFSMLMRVEELNIVFMPREYQPAGETFDERFVFVGPPIVPRHQALDFPFERLDPSRPLLYISLGSIFSNQPEFHRLCFEAFGQQPWQVVLSVGKRADLTQYDSVPENFLLVPYVPQLELLPRTQVFVTHAGTNSVMESMYYGVPMVLIPQQPEQQLHAQRTEDLGLGIMLDRTALTATVLRDAVERVANDPAYREHAQHMQQITRAAGGQQRAADAIIQFTEKHARDDH